MIPLHFFDCNASFGSRQFRHPGSFTEKETLLRKMGEFGVQKALVWHSLSKEYDPAEGNRILYQEIEENSQLLPVPALLPHYTGEFPSPDRVAEEMRAHHACAATMFPATHGFSLSEINCGPLFDMLEQYRIPLFLSLNECGIDGIGQLALSRPGLRLVLTNVTFRIDRNLYPLLSRCDNLWVETSGYKPFCGLTEICRDFGAERLLFGSGMPVSSCASAVALLTYAEIEEDEKQKIAFRNLEQLLSEVRL